jgi:hypothetical protein
VVITFCALWSCVHRSVLKPNTKGLYGGGGGSFPRIEQYFVTVPRTDVASLECESQNTRLFVGASISNTPPDMPRHVSDDEEPLEDKTAALTLHNKRTERQQRKKVTRDKKRDAIVNLTKLPTELILESLQYLEPSDVFRFSFVNRRFLHLVDANASVIGDAIIATRYTILSQCFPTPKLLSEVDPSLRPLLSDPTRQQQLGIHKRLYAHIQSPDAQQLCTCLTCILTWNNLGLVLDFAHWQHNLDTGKPIPMIARGQAPEWNAALIAQNARIARTAIDNSLWHARILQVHLDSTIRSIQRHGKNKGNKRTHVAMTAEDAAIGTDSFLSKHGPLSLEFPYHRDEYYMLYGHLHIVTAIPC